MSEWKEYKLKDICLKITDGSHKSPKAQSSGYPMFSVKDMEEYGFNYNDCKLISSEDFAEMKSTGCVPEKDDILIAKDGSYLKQIFICKESKEEAILSSIAIFRPDKNIIEPRFLMYLLKSPQVFNYIKTNCVSGSAIPRIVLKSFKDVSMRVPESITEQKRISNFLEEIDNKIITNRRICENLEAQAQALFKHWFIDFAPYKNGKFVESELGMIPEGWRVGKYSDIIQETVSGDWGKENAEGNYTHKVACIRGCDFQDVKMGLRGKTPERYILEKNYQAKHFEDKDVLVEISGGTATVSTGRVCPVSQLLIDKYNGDIVCTNFCRLVRPCKGFSSYLYYSWKYKYDHKVMFGYENGTSGIKNFSIKDFSTRAPLVLPDLSALKDFERIIEHIHAQIQNYGSESSRLSALRDTLLPKLMSGELKII